MKKANQHNIVKVAVEHRLPYHPDTSMRHFLVAHRRSLEERGGSFRQMPVIVVNDPHELHRAVLSNYNRHYLSQLRQSTTLFQRDLKIGRAGHNKDQEVSASR